MLAEQKLLSSFTDSVQKLPLSDAALAKPALPTPFQILVDTGLIREKFIRQANIPTYHSADRFAELYKDAASQSPGDLRIGTYLIQTGMLTPELIENIIVAQNADVRHHWATSLGSAVIPDLKKLVESGALATPAVMQLLRNHKHPLASEVALSKLASIIIPGTSNAINLGVTDIIEYEAALSSATGSVAYPGYNGAREEFFVEEHRLLKAMRTTESVIAKRRQVAAVVSRKDSRPLKAQLEDVWQHYAAQSSLFKKMALETPITDDVRARNVGCVNTWQAQKTHQNIETPGDRFIDIYGRYNSAEMDPFMLAIIARTAGWYIDNKHASLFTKVRLVPDRWTFFAKGRDSIPWAALVFYPKMSLLKVKEYEFRSSVLGANRFFITHSDADEATDRYSIPIIGLSTWKNTQKYRKDQPYALFGADFDRRDYTRGKNQEWKGKDQASSIAGVIEETLRALREVERLEIARAKDVSLRLRRNHRWKPSSLWNEVICHPLSTVKDWHNSACALQRRILEKSRAVMWMIYNK